MGETARIAANPCRITRCRMLARINIILSSSLSSLLLSPPLSLSPSSSYLRSRLPCHTLSSFHASHACARAHPTRDFCISSPPFFSIFFHCLDHLLLFFFSLSRCYSQDSFSRFISSFSIFLLFLIKRARARTRTHSYSLTRSLFLWLVLVLRFSLPRAHTLIFHVLRKR